MKSILAIDTALEACGVSVSNGDNVHTLYEPMGRGQTERLLPMIVDACDAVGITLKDVDAVAATRGPGSFTGVRVGLSVARTLSTVQDIPLYGFTTFEAIEALVSRDDEYGIALLSKRDDIYFKKTGEDPYLSTREEVRQQYPNLPVFGNIDDVEPLGLSRLTEFMISTVRAGSVKEGASAPMYLRNADISKSKKKYRNVEHSIVKGLS